jgi:hypothetical protein
MTVSTPATHNAAETRFVEAAGIAFAYGFVFQYPAEVAADVNAFLARDEGRAGS